MIQHVDKVIFDHIKDTVILNIQRECDCIYCPALPLYYCDGDVGVGMNNEGKINKISSKLYYEIYENIYTKIKNEQSTK